jgi:hypothetical protein
MIGFQAPKQVKPVEPSCCFGISYEYNPIRVNYTSPFGRENSTNVHFTEHPWDRINRYRLITVSAPAIMVKRHCSPKGKHQQSACCLAVVTKEENEVERFLLPVLDLGRYSPILLKLHCILLIKFAGYQAILPASQCRKPVAGSFNFCPR